MNYVPLQHVKQRLNVKPWAGKAFNEAATKRPLLSSFTCLTPHLLHLAFLSRRGIRPGRPAASSRL